MLTIDTLRAAQSAELLSDRLSAQAAVIEATESRIDVLATQAARRMAPHGGVRFADYRDEFTQVGRIAVWDLVARFNDDTPESFFRLAYRTIEDTLKDAVRSERNGASGADPDAVKTFAAMVEVADGDLYEAAKLAQTLPPKGRRLSATRAEAARLAWQGAVSIDKGDDSDSDGKGNGLIHTLATRDAEPDGEIRPKVGHGAALEALSVLRRYAGIWVRPGTPGEFAANLPTLVELLEDAVSVPTDPTERRYVLDAMNVLRSAVSTAAEGALADDLRDARDDRMADSAEKHHRVNDCLNSMGDAQRNVLAHSFGIGDATDFGWGDSGDLEGLAEYLGMTTAHVKSHRGKARKSFAKRYVAAVKLAGNPMLASALEAAAAATLTNAGRK